MNFLILLLFYSLIDKLLDTTFTQEQIVMDSRVKLLKIEIITVSVYARNLYFLLILGENG